MPFHPGGAVAVYSATFKLPDGPDHAGHLTRATFLKKKGNSESRATDSGFVLRQGRWSSSTSTRQSGNGAPTIEFGG